ncbi:MAG: hypothetical protein AAGI69_29335 [Cyanobacteria bacterium P01_H01_bin.21]
MVRKRRFKNNARKKFGRIHVYVSAKRQVEALAGLASALVKLVSATTLLMVKVSAFAAVVTGTLVVDQRSAGLPLSCSEEVLIFKELSVTEAANELFWAAHPELNRRQILPGEKELSQEWWEYYREVEVCRQELGLPL